MKMNERMKKGLSILLCVLMLAQQVPTYAFAAATAEDNLCDHHTEHTADCGYAEAAAGQECTHVHDEACGFAAAVQEQPCACEADENGAKVHTEGCGYVAGVAGAACTHSHDDSCGYAHILDEDRKVNAQKFETAFYSNPDLRGVRPPEESQKPEAATIDLAGLVEQLQKSPELASVLAALIAAQTANK